ncbi:MAG: transporter, partial [Caulobacteraceae bacterium]|nr:transporter [Caulobacteraceae bacterium]
LLPTSAQIGVWSPVLYVLLRVTQGLALGGEWGGAAIYMVEHVDKNRRGVTGSWLGGSAAFGLAGALLVVIATRAVIGEQALGAWGWRVPYVVSLLLLGVSLWIRLRLHESPLFQKLKDEGKRSEKPLTESFTQWPNLKIVLVALFAVVIAQGAIWYCAFFYASTFLEKTVKLDPQIKDTVILAMVAISVPLYIGFGKLSDRIGRKPVMMGGMALMCVALFPAFHLLVQFGNPALAKANSSAPVVVIADPADCSFQFDPVGKTQFRSACDIAKSTLAAAGISYSNQAAPAGSAATVRIGATAIPVASGKGLGVADLAALKKKAGGEIGAATKAAGYPASADPAQTNKLGVFLVLAVLAVGACALYGPQAAALVELFPTRIRYTALSLPYHIGTGWVGGFLPTTSFAIVAATGNIYNGLWYTMGFAGFALICSLLFLPETRGRSLEAD